MEVEFLSNGRLLIDVESPTVRLYNLAFRYHITGPNTVQLEGRGGGTWHVRQDADGLAIDASHGFPYIASPVTLTRAPSASWPVLSLLLLLLTLVVTLAGLPGPTPATPLSAEESDQDQPSRLFLRSAIPVALFGAGVLLSPSLWALPALLRVTAPWDAVIMLQLSLIPMLLSVRLTLRIRSWAPLAPCVAHATRLSISAFLSGVSLLGILSSLVRLTLYAGFGHYPQG
jgi:hypothetical protein